MRYVLKVDGRFVCWDSFKTRWFLGPRRLSEIFYHDPFNRSYNKGGVAGITAFPTARVVWERSS